MRQLPVLQMSPRAFWVKKKAFVKVVKALLSQRLTRYQVFNLIPNVYSPEFINNNYSALMFCSQAPCDVAGFLLLQSSPSLSCWILLYYPGYVRSSLPVSWKYTSLDFHFYVLCSLPVSGERKALSAIYTSWQRRTAAGNPKSVIKLRGSLFTKPRAPPTATQAIVNEPSYINPQDRAWKCMDSLRMQHNQHAQRIPFCCRGGRS